MFDQENKWYSEGVYPNAEQRAVCGNVVIKASLDGMGPSVDIMIKKSNTKPAFVTIELKVYVNSTKGKWMRKDFKDWTDTCSINGIPVHVDYQLIRKGLYVDVNVELKIYWHGHIANHISPNLFDNIKDYMNKPEFSDVTVCVKGEKKYLAHKIILAAQSPMLEKMLIMLNFELATAHNSSILRQSSLTFILNNYEKVKKSNEFAALSRKIDL
ncbi:Protein of unknown function [Cotesia congregata]|uniref:BTB domain-containing protein n=1 Tax=Cotesia congregata TaxID=51543 RepID=A0A8J2MWK8_COTCN|nr:Protein of unknown function [Cotesia congregata]